jgi:hypothetical protein
MFRKGRVSYSKVRAMTRVATRKNERYLLMIARHGTAHHVERVVRNYRKVKRSEALTQENTRHAQRELSWYVDDEGYWVLRGRFTPEQGALIQNALEQVMEEDFQEQKNVAAEISRGQWGEEIPSGPEPIAFRRADALARMAQAYGSGEENASNGGDRFLVHVHTDRETFKVDGTGAQAELENFGNVAAETSFPCSTLTPNPAFASRPQPLTACGWARKWMMNWRFWGCCSWSNRGSRNQRNGGCPRSLRTQ